MKLHVNSLLVVMSSLSLVGCGVVKNSSQVTIKFPEAQSTSSLQSSAVENPALKALGVDKIISYGEPVAQTLDIPWDTAQAFETLGASQKINCFAIGIENLSVPSENSSSCQTGNILSQFSRIEGSYKPGDTGTLSLSPGKYKLHLIGLQGYEGVSCPKLPFEWGMSYFAGPKILTSESVDLQVGDNKVSMSLPSTLTGLAQVSTCRGENALYNPGYKSNGIKGFKKIVRTHGNVIGLRHDGTVAYSELDINEKINGTPVTTLTQLKNIEIQGGQPLPLSLAKLTQVVDIVASEFAVSFIRADGTVVVGGFGECQTVQNPTFKMPSLVSAKKIMGNKSCAFAAITSDDKFATWGSEAGGGMDVTAYNQYLTDHTLKIVDLQKSNGAFIALLSNGEIKYWGNYLLGGYNTANNLPTFQNVKGIASTGFGFAVWTDTSYHIWGGILNSNNALISYSHPSGVSGTMIDKIIGNHSGNFIILRTDKKIHAYIGNSTNGLEDYLTSSSGLSGRIFNGIYPTSDKFAAMRDDGTLLIWGTGISSSSPVKIDKVSSVVPSYSVYSFVTEVNGVQKIGYYPGYDQLADDFNLFDVQSVSYLLDGVINGRVFPAKYGFIYQTPAGLNIKATKASGGINLPKTLLVASNIADSQGSQNATAVLLNDGALYTWGSAPNGTSLATTTNVMTVGL